MQQVRVAGRYLLVHAVGSGGMGRVWLARDEMLHRDVAIKEVVPPAWMTEDERDEVRARTLREARTAARLNHPNVVRIYDVVHSDASPWLVMEYVRSRSLQEVLQADGPLAPPRAAEIGLAVLAALRAAHRAGVLHRDVKPHNVLIADDGRVVLTDFGLATIDGGDGALTRAGIVLGSPQYVAPERVADGSSTAESDLWSLGATLYAAVEGRSPYSRPTTMATLTALAVAPPDPTERAGPLRPVLAGLLRRDPRQRLGPAEVERRLRRIAQAPPSRSRRRELPAQKRRPDHPDRLDGSGGRGTPGWRGPRRRGWRIALVATATLSLLAGLGTGLGVLGQRRDNPGPAVSEKQPEPVALSAFPCAPAPERIVRVTAGPVPADEPFGLIDNWTWYADPSGFRIAVPIGWLRYTDGEVVCFRETVSGTARVLSVDPSTPPTADAQAYLREEENRLTGAGVLTGYERISIGPLDIGAGSAMWECRWTNAVKDEVHTARMLINASSARAYTVSWLTKEFDWAVNQDYLRILQHSFRPA